MSEVEQNIVSVERILHYIELPPEAPWEVPENVPEEWPANGEVEFRFVSFFHVCVGASAEVILLGNTLLVTVRSLI